MRWILVWLCLAGALDAQVVLRVVAVERRGPPPYEAADRLYRLDGGQDRGLKVGDRLLVRRAGEAAPLGRLKVVEVGADRAYAQFESQSEKVPMKGDAAHMQEVRWLPAAPAADADPLPGVPTVQGTPPAPALEGLLFFRPEQAELSPAGQRKLEGWVQAWGTGGRWAVQVPLGRSVKPAVQRQRIETLQSALGRLGIHPVAVETAPRSADGNYDPAWIRHWE